MILNIHSADETRSFSKVKSVTLPGQNGELMILPKHAVSFIKLKAGKVVFETEKNKSNSIEIQTESVCHIENDVVSVIE